MRVSRRYWGLVGLGLWLAALSVITTRRTLLIGAATIAGILVARQALFVYRVRKLDREMTVTLTAPRQRVLEDDEVLVTMHAERTGRTPLACTVTVPLPANATGPALADRQVKLPRAEGGSTSFAVSAPVAGTISLPAPTVHVRDPFGLFATSAKQGSGLDIRVEPREPRNIHVGEGGDAVSAAYGDHRQDTVGSGLDPAELRQYLPGDSVSDIDWKATARLNDVYVREYETESDRRIVLVMDTRDHMAMGPLQERKVDYLREVALSFASYTSTTGDPVGLATVGEKGIRSWIPPGTDTQTQREIRTTLHDLRIADTATAGAETVGGPTTDTNDSVTATPQSARMRAERLRGEPSAFAEHVRPFVTRPTEYVKQLDTDPLFNTVRSKLVDASGTNWVVLCTDDTRTVEVKETVALAQQQADHVAVFLTPSVLFEQGGLTNLDEAYNSYVSFEEFRRDLASDPDVSAFEVGPGDRIEALLEASRERRA